MKVPLSSIERRPARRRDERIGRILLLILTAALLAITLLLLAGGEALKSAYYAPVALLVLV